MAEEEGTVPFPFKPWLLRSGLGLRRALKRLFPRIQLSFTPKLGARKLNSVTTLNLYWFSFKGKSRYVMFAVWFWWLQFLFFFFFWVLQVFIWGEIIVQEAWCGAIGYWIGRNGYATLSTDYITNHIVHMHWLIELDSEFVILALKLKHWTLFCS